MYDYINGIIIILIVGRFHQSFSVLKLIFIKYQCVATKRIKLFW